MAVYGRSISRGKLLSLGASAAAALAACNGGGISSIVPASTDRLASAKVAAATAPTITIDRSKTIGAVRSMLGGLSYEKIKISEGTFNATNSSLIGCFKLLGKSVLRMGGGTTDSVLWTPEGEGSVNGQVAPADINALAQFLQATGWSVIYGINLATSTPSAAAAEAAYASSVFGHNLYGFEIGNEPDFYWYGLRPSTYTYADFVREWTAFADQIRSSVPNASLTGPATGSHVETWAVPFASELGSEIELLTQHYYRPNIAGANSMAVMLTEDPTLPPMLAELKQAASVGKTRSYRISECNSFNLGGVPGVSNAYGSALWAIDFMMLNAQNGSAGVNFHGGWQNWYTPIADNNTAVVDVRAEYYAMLFVRHIPPGPMHPVSLAAVPNLTAYSIIANHGDLYLVLINKDPSLASVAAIQLGTSYQNAQSLTLTGESLTATTGTKLGGASISTSGAWSPIVTKPTPVNGATFSVTVAPVSAVLLKFT